MENNNLSAIKAIEQAIESLDTKLFTLDGKLISISKNARTISQEFKNIKTPNDVAEQIKKSSDNTKQLNDHLKEQAKLEQQLAQQIVRRELAMSETNKELIKQRVETQKINQLNRETAKLSSSLYSAYEKQSIVLSQLIRKQRDLALKKELGIKLDKQEAATLKELTREIQKKDAALKKVDAGVGRYQRGIGNYRDALRGAAGAARSLAGAMGLLGGAFLIVRTIRDAFERVREFDKAMQNMAGIVGTNREGLKGLEATIIRVAGASIKTSNEVAQLATALITLGKTPDEVEKLLEPTNNLAIALQASSDDAGQLLVGTLNAFGESANEAEKYANVIAKMRTSTALDFQQINDAMSYITPTARAMNLAVEETGAIIGVLADNNIRGERAGRLMSTAMLRMSKNGQTLEPVLDEINKLQRENASATEIAAFSAKTFGAQAAPLGLILANNREKIKDLTGELQNAQGTLDELVEQQLESLDAKLKILDSTWEKFILSLENGNGRISEAFKSVTEAITGALNGLIRFNETAEDRSKRLEDDSFIKTYEEQKKLYEDLGDSAERVAVQRADATRDTIDEIEAEIQTLKDRNAEVEESKTAVGNFFRSLAGATPLTAVLFGSEAGEIDENNAKIDELSQKLGTYNAILQASESVIEEVDESQQGLNDTLDDAEETGERNVAMLRKLIKAERERLELSTTRSEAAAVQASIKALQDELDAILGTTNARKEKQKALKGTIAFYEALIKELKKQQSSLATTTEEWKRYEERILAAKYAMDILTGEAQEFKGVGLFDEKPDTDAVSASIAAKMKEVELNQGMYDLMRRQDEEYVAQKEKLMGELYGSMTTLVNTLFDRRIQTIDDEIERNRDKYSEILDNENLTEMERSQIEAERDRKERELEKRKREEKRKSAIFNKALNIAEIGINTAAAISEASPNPFLIALAIAIGAAQLATAVATPIPQYEKGKNADSYEGLAIWGEKRREVKVGRNGIELSPSRPGNHLTHVYKDDVIYPSEQAFYSNLDKMLRDRGIAGISHNEPSATFLINTAARGQSADRGYLEITRAIRENRARLSVTNKVEFGDAWKYQQRYNNTL